MNHLTKQDLELILDTLLSQDYQKQLGTCDDYMTSEGYCRMCTALSNLQEEVARCT